MQLFLQICLILSPTAPFWFNPLIFHLCLSRLYFITSCLMKRQVGCRGRLIYVIFVLLKKIYFLKFSSNM